MAPHDDDVRISYSARELLERIEGKVDQINTDLTVVKGRVELLERDQASKVKRRIEAREMVVALTSIVVAVGSALAAVNLH
jgi:hypothetical protein